jgi:hypothetical protein
VTDRHLCEELNAAEWHPVGMGGRNGGRLIGAVRVVAHGPETRIALVSIPRVRSMELPGGGIHGLSHEEAERQAEEILAAVKTAGEAG